MNNYENLKIWQKSISVAKNIYQLTASFPNEERFGLIAQMRRSSVSIASNIAEGAGRGTDKDFRRFLDISYGSLSELDTQLHIARMLEFCSMEDYENLKNEIQEIQKMIYSLIKTFRLTDRTQDPIL